MRARVRACVHACMRAPENHCTRCHPARDRKGCLGQEEARPYNSSDVLYEALRECTNISPDRCTTGLEKQFSASRHEHFDRNLSTSVRLPARACERESP